MTEMFGEAWSPMSVPDLAPGDDDTNHNLHHQLFLIHSLKRWVSDTQFKEMGF